MPEATSPHRAGWRRGATPLALACAAALIGLGFALPLAHRPPVWLLAFMTAGMFQSLFRWELPRRVQPGGGACPTDPLSARYRLACITGAAMFLPAAAVLLARRYWPTPANEFLDSLAETLSFLAALVGFSLAGALLLQALVLAAARLRQSPDRDAGGRR